MWTSRFYSYQPFTSLKWIVLFLTSSYSSSLYQYSSVIVVLPTQHRILILRSYSETNTFHYDENAVTTKLPLPVSTWDKHWDINTLATSNVITKRRLTLVSCIGQQSSLLRYVSPPSYVINHTGFVGIC